MASQHEGDASLTPTERAVKEAVAELLQANIPPKHRRVAQRAGTSYRTVGRTIRKLEKKNLVLVDRRNPHNHIISLPDDD